MLAFVVLFTIFIGLVALYVLFTEQKKKARPAGAARLHRWLDIHGIQLPSVEKMMDIFNGVLSERKKPAGWDAPALSNVLLGTPMPQFTVHRVEVETDDCFRMICDISWPSCSPGLEMSVVEKPSGKPLTCHIQADTYRGRARIALERDTSTGDLLISFEHVSKPVVILSCVVLTPEAKDPESLASDIAETIQEAITKIKLSRIGTIAEKQPPVEIKITPAATLDDEKDQIDGPLPLAKMASGSSTASETAVKEMVPVVQEQAEPTHPSPPNTTEEKVADTKPQPPPESEDKGTLLGNQPASTQGAVSPSSVDVGVDSSTPLPMAWKRTSSYEQLHEMPAPVVSTPTTWDSSERLNLSYAGPSMNNSDTSNLEDTFSATSEENYPSTLVYEVGNLGHLRHLVAISPAHAKKLHRSFPHARKLHLYNDHMFVATHTKLKQVCSVCGEKLSGMFGKQGYQCRECQIWVHKSCHMKVETPCPNSKSSSINLIYPDSVSTASKY